MIKGETEQDRPGVLSVWRGLSLTQPWASFVANGAKRFETRSWCTTYTGNLLIHAAKRFPLEARALRKVEPFLSAYSALAVPDGTLPLGAVVATAELVGCVAFDGNDPRPYMIHGISYDPAIHESAFGDYSAGRFGFVFRNVRALRNPVPWRGALGLWGVPARLLAQVRDGLTGPDFGRTDGT